MTDELLVSGFGSVVVDILMDSPAIQIDQKNQVHEQAIQVGGVIPTALIVLSRLGIRTEFHSTVGDDLFGHTLETMLKKEHVGSTGILKQSGEKTPFAFVVIQNTGKRTSFYSTGAFSDATGEQFANQLDPKSQYLLVDGHNPHASALVIAKAKENGAQIYLDLGNPKDGLDELIAHADAIIVPQAYWKVVWNDGDPEVIARELQKRGPTLVVLTMEEKGCIVVTESDILRQPSYVIDPIDTNGAGDVFFGSFMYGRTQQWDLKKTAQFACAAAARSCSIVGKENKIPRSTDEIFAFIQSHSS